MDEKSNVSPYKIRDARPDDAADITRLLQYIGKYHSDMRPDIFIENPQKYNEAIVRDMIENSYKCSDERSDKQSDKRGENIILCAFRDTSTLPDAGASSDTEIDKRKVVGYAICKIRHTQKDALFRERRTLFVEDFCVDPSLQRSGVGRALIEEVKHRAISAGCNNIELNVWECNRGAVLFYEACGFTTQRRIMELLL